MKSDNNLTFLEIEQQIVLGHTAEARKRLKNLSVPSSIRDATIFAGLLRRVGLCSHAMSIWHNHIFPNSAPNRFLMSQKLSQSMTLKDEKNAVTRNTRTEAILEYTLNLSRLGGGKQAISLLSQTNFEQSSPELAQRRLYSLAVAHTTAWNYELAKNFYSQWLESEHADLYAVAVAHLNHSHCCLRLDTLDEAKKSIDWLLERSSSQNWILIHSNALELAARLWFQSGQLEQARTLLIRAKNNLKDRSLSDRLHVLRLEAAVTSLEDERKGRKLFSNLSREALEIGHFETLREIDLFLAVTLSDVSAAKKVFFGSPYPWIAKQISRTKFRMEQDWAFCGENFEPLEDSDRAIETCLKLSTILSKSREFKGKSGQPVLSHLLYLFSSDFYRSWSPVAIHVELFPDKVFHPEHSPPLLRSHIWRLRKALSLHKIKVSFSPSGYKLNLGNQTLLISRNTQKNNNETPFWSKADLFSLKEFAKNRNISPRTAQRVLTDAIGKGLIQRMGRGPSTRYKSFE